MLNVLFRQKVQGRCQSVWNQKIYMFVGQSDSGWSPSVNIFKRSVVA